MPKELTAYFATSLGLETQFIRVHPMLVVNGIYHNLSPEKRTEACNENLSQVDIGTVMQVSMVKT